MSGTRRVGFGLFAAAIAGLALALIGVPLLPTSPCLPPAAPLPKLALVSLGGLLFAALAGAFGLSVLLSDSSRSFRSTLLVVLGLALALGAAWFGVAILALNRTEGWSCAGG
jgi:hypothetical protein